MAKITRRELLKLGGAFIAGNSFLGCGKNSRKQPKIYRNSGEMLLTPQGRILPLDAAALEQQILYKAAAEPRHLDFALDIYGSAKLVI